MESTPLSARRITRSLAAAAASAQKSAAAGGIQTQPRAALHDITNDSPIVGLAAGGLVRTPGASTAGAKTRARPRRTPGSGEALLRGQVKTLLQKVDEEVIRPVRIQALLGLSRSPAQLLAPTPANTPQLGVESVAREDITVMPDRLIPKLQVIAAATPPPAEENLGESQLSRALVFDDSPGKSGQFADDSLTFQGGSSSDISPDEDSSSAWSIQVNVGSEMEVGEETTGELEEEEYRTEDELEEEEYNTDEEDEDDDEECFDKLCAGVSKMTVLDHEEKKKLPAFAGTHTRFLYNSDVLDHEEEKKKLPAFAGTHTRFLYNSDDEIVERKDVANAAAEHDALLRGLLVPEGKHLRFHEDDDEEA